MKSYLAFLEDLDYEPRLCRSGADAMEQFERWRPHAVMVNLALAGFDGFGFAATG